jgi:hypothetical protein
MALLAGCGSGSSSVRLATCGRLPESNGAHQKEVVAGLDLPTRVAPGATVRGQLVVSASHDVSFVSGQPFQVLILRDGRVVGGGLYGVGIAGTGIGVEPSPGHPFRYPVSVVVRGCPAKGNQADWPKTRPPLPPGDYDLVAVLEDSRPRDAGPGQFLTRPQALHVSNE